MTSLSVGVVGCGYWGPNLVRNFRNAAHCQVKTLCDLNEDRLRHMRQLYPEVNGVTDYNELLGDQGVDAVVVAAPVKYHFPLAQAALTAGKHVMIEKPMAASVGECEELVALAEKNGLILMVGHTFLYSAAVRKIGEIIRSGEIGEIRYINARRLNLGLFQKDINVAWDLAPHDISIILHLLGEYPDTVNCQGNAHVTPGIEDVTNMSLAFGKDRFATIQSSWLEPRKVREMTIVGTKGMIIYDDLQAQQAIRVYDVRVDRPPHYDTFGDFQYSYHYGDSHIPYLRQEEPLKTECQHFIDCIRSGNTPLTDGRQGLELVRILEASSQSLQSNGAPVALSRPAIPVPVTSPGSAVPSRADLGNGSVAPAQLIPA
jgi:predicted dehydrogenase